MTYEQLDSIADSVNPLLALVTLLIPWAISPSPRRSRLSFYLATFVSMAAMYLLAWIDDTLRLWPAVGLDYSGHIGFATCLLASMLFWNRRLLIPAIAALFSYAGLMLYQRYHTVADIISTSLVILPITAAIHVACDRAIRRQQLTTVREQ